MDEREFSDRVRRMSERLWHVSFACLRSQTDADDCLQEALLRAWKGRGHLKDPDLFETWLIRILINECRRFLKGRRNYDEIPKSMPAPEIDNRPLYEAMGKLKPDYRLPIILHYIEGYSVRESAYILRITEANVKVRLLRARQKLKDELESEADKHEE